jgi:hypothetical protein
MARDSARARLGGEAPWCSTGDTISWGVAPLNVDPCSVRKLPQNPCIGSQFRGVSILGHYFEWPNRPRKCMKHKGVGA